jgi:exodeoxyribonuclease VII large subunit
MAGNSQGQFDFEKLSEKPSKTSSKKTDEVVEEVEVYSVSDINRLIKSSLEEEFAFVWIKAEISNFKPHYSGHWYFNLKDEKSQISAVMFKGFNQRMKIQPEDGLEVLVRGRVTVYEPRGNYQIMCEVIEPVGLGALQKAFEKLKAKLAGEGLFEASRKKPIPKFPTRIALVTSPTGAAVRDMINVLTRRFKGLEVMLVPCAVQGAAAAGEISRAIALVNSVKPSFDVMIVGRGGGSIEDLWAFNEEIVARAIAGSEIPIISAVGHEIDFTIADFVADLRAPTPSAAAELVVQNAVQINEKVQKLERSLLVLLRGKIAAMKTHTLRLASHLVDPKKRLSEARVRCHELIARLGRLTAQKIETSRQELDLVGERLENQMNDKLSDSKHSLEKLMGILGSLNPLSVVERGYSIVTVNGKVLKSTKNIKNSDEVEIRLADGNFKAAVTEIKHGI